MDPEAIKQRITGLYADASVFIQGEGCNFEIGVISDSFRGMPVLRRQQSMLKLFETELASGALHALSIRARTPAEASASSSSLVQLDA